MAKKLKTTRWDVTEHLHSEADMAEYLQAMIDESGNDPKMIAAAIGDIARARGMTAVARRARITREALYRALSPDGNPEFATVVKVLEALHLKLTVRPVA
ncbi:MAG: putative addiction module antidote protein [Burkholderiales bacterium]|nr:putative addiction module antidote protein [Burkholderiales bacterium]